MTQIIVQAIAAIYLVVFPWTVNTHNMTAAVWYQAVPALAGAALGFFTLARFMGWPV